MRDCRNIQIDTPKQKLVKEIYCLGLIQFLFSQPTYSYVTVYMFLDYMCLCVCVFMS